MLISDCEIGGPELLSHSQAAVRRSRGFSLLWQRFCFAKKLHMSEKQGRQKQQQQRVKRRGGLGGGGGEPDAVSMRISALTQTATVSTGREKEKLFDVVCSRRLGGFSLSHADFGHRLAKCAAPWKFPIAAASGTGRTEPSGLPARSLSCGNTCFI